MRLHIASNSPRFGNEQDGRGLATPSDSEEGIRLKYLRHEVALKNLGTLFFAGCILLSSLFLVGAYTSVVTPPKEPVLATVQWVIVGILGVFATCWGLVGYQLRHLRQIGRVSGIVVSAFMLIWIPVGTLVGGYFLVVLLQEDSRFILSKDYRRIVAATPSVSQDTSMATLAIFVLAVVISMTFIGLELFDR